MEYMDKIKEILSDKLDASADEITPESLIMKDLGADSLDMVDIAMSFEEAFDVKIETEDISKIKSVQDIADFIAAKKG